MSIDKSLRRKNSLQRARNVLTRGERIKILRDEERWPDGRSPFGDCSANWVPRRARKWRGGSRGLSRATSRT